MNKTDNLIEKLANTHSLTIDEYEYLVENHKDCNQNRLTELAVKARKEVYSNHVYIRGLIEVSNYCRCNCLYCGIRRDNKEVCRYRLTKEDILSCCEEGYKAGFRTFVMQGGEDPKQTTQFFCEVIEKIKLRYPDCAVTLSLGEKSFEEYAALKQAGADRYLLRHETADSEHYSRLHPQNLTLENRMNCLKSLKQLGYQTGVGFMVGSPYQTSRHIAKDLKFIEEFSPEMCGIGPFVPHNKTPFAGYSAGSAELTCFLLSIVRLIKPTILLPSTTALGTIENEGRSKGILSGANVIMPNLSPIEVRKKYELYDNKLISGAESAEQLELLQQQMRSIGYEIVVARGDCKI